MIGLLPAVAANLLVLPGMLPFAEDFGWASFRLGAPGFGAFETAHLWRAAFLVLALLAFGAGAGRWPGLRLVLVLPLLLAALHPSDRIGSFMDYGKRLGASAEGFDAAAATNRVEAIERQQAAFGGALTWLPPHMPSSEWLRLRLQATTTSVDAWRGPQSALAARVTALRDQLRQANDALTAFDLQRNKPLSFGSIPGLLQQRGAILAERQNLTRELGAADAALDANDGAGRRIANLVTIDFAAALDLHERRLADKANLYLSLPYLLASLAVFAWFLWTFGVLNATARVVLAVWAAGLLANAASVWWGEWHLFLFAGLYPVAITALAAVCVRFVMRAWLDNADILQSIKPEERRRQHGKAMLYWLPFLAVVTVIVGGKSFAMNALLDQLYCKEAACAAPGELKLVDTDPARFSLRDDMHFLATKALARIEIELAAAAAAGQTGTPEALANARAIADNAFNTVFQPNIWDYSGSGVPDVDKCIPFKGFSASGCGYYIGMNGINRAYRRQVDRIWAWYDDKLDRAQAAVQAGVDQVADGFQEGIDGLSTDLTLQTRRGIDAVFLGFAGFSAMQWALILMVCGRALLTIEARLIFRTGAGRLMPRTFHTMAPPAAITDKGGAPTLRKTETSRLVLKLGRDEQLLIRSGYDPDNANTLTALVPPSVWRWTFSRLFAGTLRLKTIVPRRNADPPVISDSQGICFIAMQVPEGTSVVFRWRNFFAMTKGARLGRILSLRLPFVVLGHVALPVIHGPARLVLRSHGVPKITTREDERPSVAPYRVLAWSQSSTFAVAALEALNIPTVRISPLDKAVSVYLDDCQILPASTAHAVLDAGQESSGGSGILREFWKLLRL